MVNLNFVLFLTCLMLAVSLITALVIETIKKVVSEEKIKEIFKSLEVFSLVFTVIVAFITYLVFLLFFIVSEVAFLDVIKLIVAGILFIFACACGSQVGYDKVIKVVKQIIEILKAGLL